MAVAVAGMERADRQWRVRLGLEEAGSRLDQVWGDRLAGEGVSRSRVAEWIKSGLALVDGRVCRKPSHRLAGSEELVLGAEARQTRAEALEGDVRVLWRDERLLVIDKPAGLTTHPAPSCNEPTLVHRLLYHFPQLAGMDAWRPGIVHRLDKDTSGLMLVALDEAMRLDLAREFAARRVHKTYLALVHGRPKEPEGEIDLAIGRHPLIKTRMAVTPKGGRRARSLYKVLYTDESERFSLVSVAIETGRTHQIRVHMSHLGHPLIGDATYGAAAKALLERERPVAARLARRHMLHAFEVGFTHPETGKDMRFRLPPPADFRRLPLVLARRVQRVGLTGMPGCGKSTVLSMIEAAGVKTISSDRIVADLYSPGRDGWRLIRGRFGDRFALEQGGVDKAALFQAMRAEPQTRREVMDMVHPLVQHEIEGLWQAAAGDRLAVAEVPLLIEAGWDLNGLVDEVLCVECQARGRLERLAARTGWSLEVAAQVDSWQWPWPEKRRRCGLVIDNSGDLEGLAAETRRALDALRRKRADRARGLRALLDRAWGLA